MDFAKFDQVIKMPGVLDQAISCMRLQNDEHHYLSAPDRETSHAVPVQPLQLQQFAAERRQDSQLNQHRSRKPRSICQEADSMR